MKKKFPLFGLITAALAILFFIFRGGNANAGEVSGATTQDPATGDGGGSSASGLGSTSTGAGAANLSNNSADSALSTILGYLSTPSSTSTGGTDTNAENVSVQPKSAAEIKAMSNTYHAAAVATKRLNADQRAIELQNQKFAAQDAKKKAAADALAKRKAAADEKIQAAKDRKAASVVASQKAAAAKRLKAQAPAPAPATPTPSRSPLRSLSISRSTARVPNTGGLEPKPT